MLPIESVLAPLTQALAEQPTVILQAPPGAGKSTFLPLHLLKQGQFKGKIVLLEPRRLAARSIAHFMAKQLNEPVGQTVGYRIRQESRVSAQTRLEIVTEGILTRLIQSDPELAGVDLVIFDEFHERSIHADLALTLSLEVQGALREDLRLLVMSATLDSDYLADILDAPVISSEGRSYPVEVRYESPQSGQLIGQVATLIARLAHEESGSMLVFLPGAREIRGVEQQLNALALPGNINIYPLYGDLDKGSQQAAIEPCKGDERKVVLATNIAETSLTIDGIRLVIDSGLKRHAGFNPKNGVTRLQTVNIAKSSAIQRAGRAGRLMPGICYRLDSGEGFARRMDFDEPQILTSDLMPLVLEVAQWGATMDELQWVSKPPQPLVDQARDLLVQLEVFDNEHKVTPLGQAISELGCHPRIGHMLIKAKSLAKAVEAAVDSLACVLAAIVEQGDPLPKGMRNQQCNMENRVRWVMSGNNKALLEQARHWARRVGVKFNTSLPLEYCGLLLAMAYPDRIAKGRGQGFQLSNGFGVVIDSQDPLAHSPLLVIADLVEFDRRTLVSMAAPVSLIELQAYLGHLVAELEYAGWDSRGEKLIVEQRTCLGALVLDKKPVAGAVSAEQRTAAFVDLLRRKGLGGLNWSDEVSQYRLRMRWARKLLGDDWPDAGDDALLAALENWLAPFLGDVGSVAALNKLNIMAPLKSLLDWGQQQQLDELLPERFTVPTGNRHKIHYRADEPPKLSVRIQEMFGVVATPTLARGQLPLLVELLSPARRPLQLTGDLAGFWQGSYREVQKEMKGRYPKHYWPDDPSIAEPTTRTRRHMSG